MSLSITPTHLGDVVGGAVGSTEFDDDVLFGISLCLFGDSYAIPWQIGKEDCQGNMGNSSYCLWTHFDIAVYLSICGCSRVLRKPVSCLSM